MTGDPANLSLFFFSFLTDTFWPSGICGPLVRCEMVAQWTAPANDYNDVTVKKKNSGGMNDENMTLIIIRNYNDAGRTCQLGKIV